jgi:energy-coupling factor transporter ATP-binding protein EcfA2
MTAPAREPESPRDDRPDGDISPTPIIAWGDFLSYFRGAWNQGEHLTMIGTTGSGKTTLLQQIIGLRHYVVIFGVKGRDESMEQFLRAGFTRITDWRMNEVSDYLVLWPKIRGYHHTDSQREIFRVAMDGVYRQGGWCCVFDEVSYLADTLNMDRQLKFLLQQGRSSGVSVVGMTQRPAFIPLAFYDQATHLFFWRDNDRRNLQRFGELAGNARQVVQKEVATLQKREVLYLHKDSGYRVRTTVEV